MRRPTLARQAPLTILSQKERAFLSSALATEAKLTGERATARTIARKLGLEVSI